MFQPLKYIVMFVHVNSMLVCSIVHPAQLVVNDTASFGKLCNATYIRVSIADADTAQPLITRGGGGE